MERRSKRMKSLLIRPSNLDSLIEPIKKEIKPSQVYNDYKLPLRNNLWEERSENIVKTKRHVRYGSIGSNTINCACECHKAKCEDDRKLSTAHNKRALLTPSPEKVNKTSAISRKSSENSTIFPYKSYDLRTRPELPSLSRYRLNGKRASNNIKY